MNGCSSWQIRSRTCATVALRLGLLRRIDALALQHRLGEFQIPVAELVPDEAIGRAPAASLNLKLGMPAAISSAARAASLRIQRLSGCFTCGRIEARDPGAAIHLGEAGRVPDLGREIAVALDTRRR